MEETHFRVPRALLKHAPDMSLSTLSIYLQLCSRLEPGRELVSLSTADLAGITGLKQRTVFTALAHLKRLGLITRVPSGQTKTSEYHLLVPDEGAVEGDARSIPEPDVQQEVPDSIVEPAQDTFQASRSLMRSPADSSDPPDNHTESLDDLIASVYSTKCRASDLEVFVDLSERHLRECLEWLRADGGVDAETPIGFFAAVILTVWKKLSGE